MSDKLRVLSLSTLFPSPARPGFGRFVERQFAALAARGDVDLTVVNPIPRMPWPLSMILRDPSRSETLDPSRGYPVHHPRFVHVPKLGARSNPSLIASAVLPLVRRLHAEQPFDVIDAQFFYPDGPAAARIASELRLPLTIKARGSDIHYWGAQTFALRQMLSAAAQSKRLLAVSAALKADMAALGMANGKIAVHYTGLDHAVFHPRERAEARALLAGMSANPVPVSGHLIVTTGNLIPLKGQALVIRALDELPDVRLLVAGSGPDLASLRALAAELGLAGRIHFGTYGPADLAVALAGADAMVLPSEREGLANAWIEALACGTPIVITDVGGAREVIDRLSAGRLVERTPAAIAAAVRDLLAVPPAPTDVAVSAARFSWEACAEQLAAIYREAAAE